MDSGKCGDNLMWLLSGDSLVINGTGKMVDYFPTFIFRMPFWRVKHCDSIKNIIIKYDVTSIGNYAFYACMNLKKVTISASVISIGNGAFGWCKKLEGITIPDSVISIGEGAFDWCTNLKEIKIPDSVTMIGEQVFKDCSSLKKIRYPAERGFEKNLSAGNNAQLIPYTGKAPVEELKFIPVVKPIAKSIAAESLRWKVEGKTLTVGGVSEIKAYSYEETPWRDSLSDIQRIIIEDGVEKISARTFEECRRLELLTIPASVHTIGDMAFSICYCGNGLANGGRNVYWTLEDGVLNLKKNPTVRGDADFSTGAVTWLAVEKNITGIKLEAGVVAKEKFFEWLSKRSNAMQIAFG